MSGKLLHVVADIVMAPFVFSAAILLKMIRIGDKGLYVQTCLHRTVRDAVTGKNRCDRHSYNRDWKILGALNFLHRNHYERLKDKCPFLTPGSMPGTFYIQKV